MIIKEPLKEITSKKDIVKYFQNGCKKENQLDIGIEHEKFLFEQKTNERINFQTVSEIFDFLIAKFGWKSIKEDNNVIALSRDGQSITLEPGNQIELSGARLNSIHLVCEESYKFLKLDPLVKKFISPTDVQRSIRAYEVKKFTNESLFELIKKTKSNFNSDIFIKLLINFPKELLHDRIKKRVKNNL